MTLYDSIIPCFGSRFTVVTMPSARRYRVFPLGTFHFFDWQKSDTVGISIGTCPQIVSSETAQIGVQVGDATRILPFDEGVAFSHVQQSITPLTTRLSATDEALPLTCEFTFRSAFYPQSFEYSCAPAYTIEVAITNTSAEKISGQAFFALPMVQAHEQGKQIRSIMPIEFPQGIDHEGIDNLVFEQILTGDRVTQVTTDDIPTVWSAFTLEEGATTTIRFYHAGYIAQPTLNRLGDMLKFGYTSLWDNASDVLAWWQSHRKGITTKGDIFEATVLDTTVPEELKLLLSSSFKGLASNAWWAEDDWFSVMEIGAYHSTLDVDFQLALFFFQYWDDLILRMLRQWARFYKVGSGYMAHDVGQHLEATGNRYGGPDSAMKVEENCNYILLAHHYWRVSGDDRILGETDSLIRELVNFLIASDTDNSGLPNRYADNTNDWGSGLITASEEQSYHGVRLIATYTAVAQIAQKWGDETLQNRCLEQIALINQTMAKSWQGDHYPIALSDPDSYHHYSMWTTHGLLYALRSGMTLDIDLDKLRIDLINSTRRTMREHGCTHSTVDVRGWLTQNLWRDCIGAYLGVDLSDNLRRYLGHGEYVSYEDTTILEVANELMVVPGAIAEHSHAGEMHDFPMVDGHPRPACAFGLPYALGGVQYDTIHRKIRLNPVAFPLKIALTHLADWANGVVATITFSRSIPNQDSGNKPITVSYSVEHEYLLEGWEVELKA